MEHEVVVLRCALISALVRQSDVNERFADQLTAIVGAVFEGESDRPMRDSLLSLARQHRISAMGSRAQIAALAYDLPEQFGGADAGRWH